MLGAMSREAGTPPGRPILALERSRRFYGAAGASFLRGSALRTPGARVQQELEAREPRGYRWMPHTRKAEDEEWLPLQSGADLRSSRGR